MTEIWIQIKKYWRKKFAQTEIYSDENEHIIIFKVENAYIIIGYYHYNSCFWMSANNHIDFINFIKELGSKSYNPFKIYLLCNCPLNKITKSEEILSLPKDVTYYHVDYNWFYETIKFEVQELENSAKISEKIADLHKMWYERLHIPIIRDARFEDWNKWAINGYERKWYDWKDDDKFDYDRDTLGFAEVYIDERLLGIYLVWKWESDIDKYIDELDDSELESDIE